MPKCSLYHWPNAAGFFARKNRPPIPVTCCIQILGYRRELSHAGSPMSTANAQPKPPPKGMFNKRQILSLTPCFSSAHYPQVRNALGANPKGIVSSSPGLRGTSYPGKLRELRLNPIGVASTLLTSGRTRVNEENAGNELPIPRRFQQN